MNNIYLKEFFVEIRWKLFSCCVAAPDKFLLPQIMMYYACLLISFFIVLKALESVITLNLDSLERVVSNDVTTSN